uniref:Uncharacterized protein n=1 Tax=viral metagenome TaxID=1070528 RepID=A0A6M3KJW1_9ZZZZ
MTEKDAIELLDKLQSFMENTNKNIQALMIKVHNLEVDIDKLKKDKQRLIIAN